MSQWIFDTDEGSFERDVIERSKTVPVAVDFWAPWCGPCHALGPLLERLVIEQGGAFQLARVNVDKNPQLAAAFGARSIPMVLGLRDGKVVSEFVGAQPESVVRAFVARLLPSEGDRVAMEADRLAAAGKAGEAEAEYRRALELDPRSDRALVGLARAADTRQEFDAALAYLDRVAPGTPLRQEADRLAAAIRIRQTGGADEAALRAKLAQDPGDLEARFALAQTLAAAERHEEALRELLEILNRDRAFRDGAARTAMLDIFSLIGSGNEMVERYRSEMARVLFR